ncbi:hypothetical protein EVAR_85185_1 [Eumeta japonica]|uniref:Uncharacterized protein n=1 Tax=Eumeta variegata TaxID=151549 RepID=A0A4C1VYY1_EUMVA|nr:hypothetical protein EVAR_85185_1 [Eumeta japonica]
MNAAAATCTFRREGAMLQTGLHVRLRVSYQVDHTEHACLRLDSERCGWLLCRQCFAGRQLIAFYYLHYSNNRFFNIPSCFSALKQLGFVCSLMTHVFPALTPGVRDHGRRLSILQSVGRAIWCNKQHTTRCFPQERDAALTLTPTPTATKFPIERRMAPLSLLLSGLVLPHDTFGNHLDTSGKTINSDLELKNLTQAELKPKIQTIDKLQKLTSLIEILRGQLKKVPKEEFLVEDEQMTPMKAKTSSMRQYNARKHKTDLPKNYPDLGASGNVVTRLVVQQSQEEKAETLISSQVDDGFEYCGNTSNPKPFSQNELNDLIRDLDLSKERAY